ncbi:kunitz-type serine protease inhibitor Vur-KIn-like [Dermacentor variabilis]|uniref:kunitz-type serine protease inhibitor Vur-KIn-like n=1 Tax=Dermacentor variabilis TaxID=34621 RepID=UPI003F5C76E2
MKLNICLVIIYSLCLLLPEGNGESGFRCFASYSEVKCPGKEGMWYFEPAGKLCKAFKESICGSPPNSFPTCEDCQKTCNATACAQRIVTR